MAFTEGQDQFGNPTFTVGVLTVTAYPRHGGHAQISFSDPNFACLPWTETDLVNIAEAFNAAARAAVGCECDEPACQWCEVHGETGNPPITDHDLFFDDEDDPPLRFAAGEEGA